MAHLGRGGHRLEEMAAGVGQARGASAAAGRRDLVVAAVHVDDERACRAAEDLGGRVAASTGAEAVVMMGAGSSQRKAHMKARFSVPSILIEVSSARTTGAARTRDSMRATSGASSSAAR
jgi:hypothetical protein